MEMAKVSFGDDAIPGYECGDKTLPGVIVLQEWWGVTENIKKQALYISSKGYRCLVPDLYKGKLGVTAEEAHHLMGNLDWSKAKGEICEAAKYLKATGAQKVGVVGFCMGGALTLIGAQHSDDVDCAAPFYGTPDRAICQPEKITKPVQGHFGADDNMAGFSDPTAAAQLAENLKAAGGDYEVFSYPGVGHAFMNDLPEPYPDFEARKASQGFPGYDEGQVILAWQRLIAFFDKHLQ
uniref:Dienelactone hydrolase domain-containing protein n=1 Tax=Mantoniella antarctica TaxID=81844 RepID=A0A7S0SG32_9CHLO|mmetsp:Transcript_23528/g.58279  ORF Transcript_23528/g.58279 Transcript_23528/m.58279 type:complete len:237 (+) Transcript_23528:253-963(+)